MVVPRKQKECDIFKQLSPTRTPFSKKSVRTQSRWLFSLALISAIAIFCLVRHDTDHNSPRLNQNDQEKELILAVEELEKQEQGNQERGDTTCTCGSELELH